MNWVRRLWCWLTKHDENIGAPIDPDAPMQLYCRRCGVVLDADLGRWWETEGNASVITGNVPWKCVSCGLTWSLCNCTGGPQEGPECTCYPEEIPHMPGCPMRGRTT